MASDHVVQVSGWPVNGRLLDGGWWTVGGYGILSIGCRQCRGGGRHSSDGGLKRGWCCDAAVMVELFSDGFRWVFCVEFENTPTVVWDLFLPLKSLDFHNVTKGSLHYSSPHALMNTTLRSDHKTFFPGGEPVRKQLIHTTNTPTMAADGITATPTPPQFIQR